MTTIGGREINTIHGFSLISRQKRFVWQATLSNRQVLHHSCLIGLLKVQMMAINGIRLTQEILKTAMESAKSRLSNAAKATNCLIVAFGFARLERALVATNTWDCWQSNSLEFLNEWFLLQCFNSARTFW